MESKKYVWMDGKVIRYEDAKVGILTHSLQYGSGIFEGMRAYKAKEGTAIFRLHDHIKRFLNSAKIYEMNLGFSQAEIEKASIEILKKNKLEKAYIRPFAFYNDTNLGVSVTGKKVSVAIAAVSFGNYFPNKDKGIKCKVSSWQRINSKILPPEAKASGNYINSIIASIEAKNEGADEAILTSSNGYVAEGPGENIFIVEDGVLVTPSRDADILLGLTRDSIIKIAEMNGIQVTQRNIHKEELYTCDEAFFTGTAAEITPIVSIDSRKIGEGKIGPVTQTLEKKFYEVVSGNNVQFADWLTYI